MRRDMSLSRVLNYVVVGQIADINQDALSSYQAESVHAFMKP
jgi:hypothetical protein